VLSELARASRRRSREERRNQHEAPDQPGDLLELARPMINSWLWQSLDPRRVEARVK
jgi:hypothetical protein